MELLICDLIAFPGSCIYERLVGFCVKVDCIGTAIVPSAANTGVADDFMVGDDLYFGTYELLSFAGIGYGAFT